MNECVSTDNGCAKSDNGWSYFEMESFIILNNNCIFSFVKYQVKAVLTSMERLQTRPTLKSQVDDWLGVDGELYFTDIVFTEEKWQTFNRQVLVITRYCFGYVFIPNDSF